MGIFGTTRPPHHPDHDPEYAGHPSSARGEELHRFPLDEWLRRHGYRIHTRPVARNGRKAGPVLWETGNAMTGGVDVVTEEQAVRMCREEEAERKRIEKQKGAFS